MQIKTVEDKITCLKEKIKIKEKYGPHVKGERTHSEHIMDSNIKTLLRLIPGGSDFIVTSNGKIMKRTNRTIIPREEEEDPWAGVDQITPVPSYQDRSGPRTRGGRGGPTCGGGTRGVRTRGGSAPGRGGIRQARGDTSMNESRNRPVPKRPKMDNSPPGSDTPMENVSPRQKSPVRKNPARQNSPTREYSPPEHSPRQSPLTHTPITSTPVPKPRGGRVDNGQLIQI